MVLAVVVLVFGLLITAGGAWLATLGGSWYYLPAGVGLLVTGWLLMQRSMTAVWVYLAVFAGTVFWAFWEAGMNGWAQVPRLVAPTVILVLVLASIPVLRRSHHSAQPGRTVAGALAAVGLGSLLAMLPGQAMRAQETAPAEDAAPGTQPAPVPSPTEETAPATQPAPVEDAAPATEAAPAEDTAPAEEAAPAAPETAPADVP
ncbi:MAG: membrane-bound PQQ-dependent dehydrogenase, glucose/quinate/shikimate family, partial [Cereibacter changlensis]